MRILLVEDNARHAELIERELRADGIEVAWVQSAEEALRRLPREHFQAVLCDMMLPGMDGLEFARRAKNLRCLKGVTLIAISSSSMRAAEERALEAGFRAFLAKPFEPTLARQVRELAG